MKIVVAGAGAGKTTSLAEVVLERYKQLETGKRIFVVTFTNMARNLIRKKVIQLHGSLPNEIHIETYHAFLLQEIIFPFYHHVYNQKIRSVSTIGLPIEPGFRAARKKELRENGKIHVEDITNVAKWVMNGKSGEKKGQKKVREQVVLFLKAYIDSVFVDEAQDIDGNVKEVLECLDTAEVYIQLVGDPKQDLRGSNIFKSIVECHKSSVEYISTNYRMPKSHILLANKFVSESEKQDINTEKEGCLMYLFEKDVEVADFIQGNFDLVYISKKNAAFNTGENENTISVDTLKYEVRKMYKKYLPEVRERDKKVYDCSRFILQSPKKRTPHTIVTMILNTLKITLEKSEYARLIDAVSRSRVDFVISGVQVMSIDKVKGLEGEKCLFILNNELSNYFFEVSTDQNKVKNYLYVALTRAKEKLVVLVTVDTEKRLGREMIETRFRELCFTKMV